MRRIVLLLLILCIFSCQKGREQNTQVGHGRLSLALSRSSVAELSSMEAYKDIDTNSFILEIKNAKEEIIYKGEYGRYPDKAKLKEGKYLIRLCSEDFEKPAFDKIVYGDNVLIYIKDKESTKIELNCKQINAGVRLQISPSFLDYEGALIWIRSKEGKLPYSYRERRIAYFLPGVIEVIMTKPDNKTDVLYSKKLEMNQVLDLKLALPGKKSSLGGNYLAINVDTARTWITVDSKKLEKDKGVKDNGKSYENALSVAEAKRKVGMNQVWVLGYIVGGDMSKAEDGISFDEPFKSDTHFAISARAIVFDKADCIAVELPKGKLRTALNLKENSELLGKQIYIKGDIVDSYFGTIGLKKVKDYKIK